MHRRITYALLAFLILAAFHAHPQQPSSPVGKRKIVIVGSQLFMPLVTDIARRFEEADRGVAIELRLTGVAEGLSIVRVGRADIAMLPRPLRIGEEDLFAYPIARGGVAFLVNRENRVSNITRAQLADILTGRIGNWKTLGGADAPVRLAWRTGEGSAYFIIDYLKLKREQVRPSLMVDGNEESIKFAASEPNGITFASVGFSERSATAGIPIKLLTFEGIPAATRTIQNRAYPLSRPLMLVTRSVAEGLQKRFIDYAGSPPVLDLQLKHGVVPFEN